MNRSTHAERNNMEAEKFYMENDTGTVVKEITDNTFTFPHTHKGNGWVNDVDICATCPNRPGGPLNISGFCMCSIPSMYGPYRITC